MLRKPYAAATMALVVAVMSAAMTGCPEDVKVRFNVTVQNLTPLQTFGPLIAVTHSDNIALFRLDTAASASFTDFVENANLAGLVTTLDGLDAVTDIYQSADGLGLPLTAGGTITFSILGKEDDLFSIAAPNKTTLSDDFAGLDAVPLPIVSRTYLMDSFVLFNGNVDLSPLLQNVVRVTITRAN